MHHPCGYYAAFIQKKSACTTNKTIKRLVQHQEGQSKQIRNAAQHATGKCEKREQNSGKRENSRAPGTAESL